MARLFDNHGARERQLAMYRERGVQIPIDGGVPGFSRYFYADTRREIGSIVECSLFEDAARDCLESIPRN